MPIAQGGDVDQPGGASIGELQEVNCTVAAQIVALAVDGHVGLVLQQPSDDTGDRLWCVQEGAERDGTHCLGEFRVGHSLGFVC